MEASERDTTDEWRITPARAPATVVELEGRIDLALATARAAEEAALEIGAASLEAAQQAHRAAALAERASATAVRAAADAAAARIDPPRSIVASPAEREPVVPPSVAPPSGRISGRRPDPFDERITAFRERAEKVMIRLQKLEAGDPPGASSPEIVRLR
jgi:hypothetical protein